MRGGNVMRGRGGSMTRGDALDKRQRCRRMEGGGMTRGDVKTSQTSGVRGVQ
jgi:hypothetical protein